MTMKRSEKARHQDKLANVSRTGHVAEEFQKPSLLIERRAQGKSAKMTPAEYREYRMRRGQMSADRVEQRRRTNAEIKSGQRELGGRRVGRSR